MSRQYNMDEVKAAILADKTVTASNGWSIYIDANDSVVMWPPEGDGYITGLSSIDHITADFCKKSEMPIPEVKGPPSDAVKVPKNVLGPDSSSKDISTPEDYSAPKDDVAVPQNPLGPDSTTRDKHLKAPEINQHVAPEGKMTDTNLGPDSSTVDSKIDEGAKVAQFMQPQIVYGEWARVEDEYGESYWVPGEYKSDPAIVAGGQVSELVQGYGAQLSAPGYLDQTDWEIFDTEEEAKSYLEEISGAEDFNEREYNIKGKIIDTFIDKEPTAKEIYADYYKKRPSAELLENIMDEDKWCATQALNVLAQYDDKESAQECAGNNVEAVSPPGLEHVVKELKEDPNVDNPWAAAWDIKKEQKGKQSVRLREKWNDGGAYDRDIEAESAEELHALTRAFGGEDVDWSAFKAEPMMEAQGVGYLEEDDGTAAFRAEKDASAEAESDIEAVDDDAKDYYTKYFGDYGKELTEDDVTEKAPKKKDKKDKKDKEKKAQSDIYNVVQELGIPMETHESDLYIPVTPETKELIDQYEYEGNVSTFTSHDGTQWFEIPFAAPMQGIMGSKSSQTAPAPQEPAAAAPAAPAPAEPAAPTTAQPGAPAAPTQQGLKPGTGNEGVKALGWTDEDIKGMDDKQKEGILQLKLKKPMPAAGDKPIEKPKTPVSTPKEPVPAPEENLPPVVSSMDKMLKIVEAQMVEQQTAPVADPVADPVAEAAPVVPEVGDVEGETPESKAFKILEEVQQMPINASNTHQLVTAKSEELTRRLVAEAGMTIPEAEELFGVKNKGLTALFR